MKKILFLSVFVVSLFAEIPNNLFRECSQGNSKSCFHVAKKQLDLSSPDYNPSLGRDNLNSSCNGLYAPACFMYGKYFEENGDKSLAQSYYKKSCDLGSSNGCYYYNRGKK